MESISTLNRTDKVRYNYLFIIGLMLLSGFAIVSFGIKGLALSILALVGLIMTPVLYNKPKLFLFFSLFIYPLTRILPLDDKFIITGGLYALSMPCIFWIIKKRFGSISNTSFYLWSLVFYIGVILLNYFRPETGIIELAKEFGRAFFAIFIILSVHNYVENRPEGFQKLARYLSYIINIIALIAIGQYITKTGGMINEGFYRVRGTFFNFNDYGYVISLFICFALYILLTSQRHRLYWVLTIGLNLIALAGTFSKTSIINTALVFVIMSLFLPWRRKLQLFAGTVASGSLLTLFLISTGSFTALVARFTDTSSLEWRFEMWRRLYHMILQGNILLGQGINASKDFLQVLVPQESNAPHNVYLETTYDLGLVGLIPFVMIFLFILFQGISIWADKGTAKNQNKIIGTAIIVISVITMIQNYVSNAFYDRAGNIYFWAILTLLVCRYKYYKTENPKTNQNK